MHGHPDTGDSTWGSTVQFKIMLPWSNWDGTGDGVPVVLNTSLNSGIYAAALTATRVAVVYYDGTYTGVKLINITITGTVITFTAVIVDDTLGTHAATYMAIATLSVTSVVISYFVDSLNVIKCVVCSIVGPAAANVTVGALNPISTDPANTNGVGTSIGVLSSTSFMISTAKTSVAEIRLSVYTVSGTIITLSAYVDVPSLSHGVKLVTLSPTIVILVAWHTVLNALAGVPVTYSGGTQLTTGDWGALYGVTSWDLDTLDACRIDDTYFAVVCTEGGRLHVITAKLEENAIQINELHTIVIPTTANTYRQYAGSLALAGDAGLFLTYCDQQVGGSTYVYGVLITLNELYAMTIAAQVLEYSAAITYSCTETVSLGSNGVLIIYDALNRAHPTAKVLVG